LCSCCVWITVNFSSYIQTPFSFFAWVAAAGLVAIPLAEWVLHGWLRNFAFRVALRPTIFVLAGALALGIALVAVGAQSFRAALADPADSLKYE